ncbi:Neuroligin-4, X-linked [Operophtera brumata]|uniref:Neuroligin-4, X-linked n=1 Tax=Operophtera brumata TaxID=104452 RepID=A0A0L7KR12_OPEBR|nr:Neuroligin-4, X-linked [Operophtera brumata]
MSGSALSDWALTKDPTQLSEIKKVQILARKFETPLGPTVAGSFIPSEPAKTMEAFPNLLSKYQLLSGVTELESYHDFGALELDHGVLENQRDTFITNYAKIVFDSAENEALEAILKKYAPTKLDPQRWTVESNRDVILNLFSDSRTLAPCIRFADYQAKANRQSYFYVFGHNSVSSDFAALNKSVHGEELPYILGVPLGGANTHFLSDYTIQEKLLSEVMMRLWTNFVKIGSPNTQSVNKYYTLDHKQWNQYNVEWPEYDVVNQPYLRIDPIRKIWSPHVAPAPHYVPPSFGKVRPYSQPARPDTDIIYRQIQSIKTPSRPVPSGLMDKATTQAPTAKPKTNNIPVKTSSATVTLIISLGILFLVFDVAICSILYFKKRKLRLREQTLQTSRLSRAEIGEVDLIGQKGKEDKGAIQTLKNGCSVIKSMSFNKKRGSVKKIKKKTDTCKPPKSDDSGGFRERFQLRRHLSTSTLDAHTKVRDWIANEVMHRCSPAILRKSNSDINNDKHLSVVKPFTRSEELLSDNRRTHSDHLKINDGIKNTAKNDAKGKTSEKTTSTSALGSHSSITSNKHSINSIKKASKSSDSLKSKATESIKSKKVSVAIDATPSARTRSILHQEPIKILKSFDSSVEKDSSTNQLRRSKTEGEIKIASVAPEQRQDSHVKTFTNEVTLSVSQDKPLVISHKHSRSDPVTDVNYEKLFKEKMEAGIPVIDILPPVTFRNDINVTSRDESSLNEPLSAEEALLTIRRMNFPKVLPDLPKAQKRLSLQPTALQTFRSYSTSVESQSERSKFPPQPPPRTTTLERRLAYKNTKPLSSFDASNVKKISEADISQNYVNINSLSPDTQLWKRSFEKSILTNRPEPTIAGVSKEREIPKVIIASSHTSDSTIHINPSLSRMEISTNVPRVKLPDDFHCERTGSVTSFSSFYSDDDEDEDTIIDDLLEDKLLQELVGGVDSPTNMEDELDSKGPDSIFERKLEIIPVKINTSKVPSKYNEDYVCVSDLYLPDLSGIEPTAQIKSNFSLNKLQNRTDSINRPPEKAIKMKQRKSIKPSILTRNMKNKSSFSKSDSKLEHSTSGSSNDTETSTGTVKKVDVKRDN